MEACLNLQAIALIAPFPLIALAIGVSSIWVSPLLTNKLSLENESSSVENDQHSILLHMMIYNIEPNAQFYEMHYTIIRSAVSPLSIRS